MSEGSRTSTPARGTPVWRRYTELPRYLRAVQGRAELARLLGEVTVALGFEKVGVVSGATFTAALGADLARALPAVSPEPVRVESNTQAEVERVAQSEVRGSDVVVAVGGGKTIDVAKSACDSAGLPLIVVPTQLTADGIASPVSVIRATDGTLHSGHGRLPIAVVVDLDVIAASPPERTRAGLGDLLANQTALVDWRLAAEAGLEEVDDFAALLAQSASDLVYGSAPTGLVSGHPESDFLHRLLRGLVLSGLAMEIAGSSRPCSGAEHLISHALDALRPGTAQHGEQVAFGTLVATRLQGGDWMAVRVFMLSAGLVGAASGFGLPAQELIDAVRAAPSMRPDRHTVLSDPACTEAAVGDAVRDVVRAATPDTPA
ncbi:MAG: iron-containing alcohol dehydrogenase [Solirubrobacterales bacterium]